MKRKVGARFQDSVALKVPEKRPFLRIKHSGIILGAKMWRGSTFCTPFSQPRRSFPHNLRLNSWALLAHWNRPSAGGAVLVVDQRPHLVPPLGKQHSWPSDCFIVLA